MSVAKAANTVVGLDAAVAIQTLGLERDVVRAAIAEFVAFVEARFSASIQARGRSRM